MNKLFVKFIAMTLALTLSFSINVFADGSTDEDPQPKIDIGSNQVEKDLSSFVKTMYYEPRERINNVIFYYGGHDLDHRLSSVKDYVVEYENNLLPGTVTATYTGVGNYTGTYVAKFTILKMPIANITTTASFNSKKQLTVSASSASEKLVLGTDFTISTVTDVDGNVTVTFTGIGKKYTGTCKKTISAKDNPNPSARSYLKDVVLTKCKNIKGKKIKLKWRKINNIAGYELRYSKKSSLASAKKITLANTKKSYTTGKLKKKKTYYLRMRCYIVYNNKKYYGNWTKVAKVKIKK